MGSHRSKLELHEVDFQIQSYCSINEADRYPRVPNVNRDCTGFTYTH